MRKRNERLQTTKKHKATVVTVKILEHESYYKHPVHVRYIRDRLSRTTPSEKSTQAFRRVMLDRSE
jgi:hypothetical protein